MPSIPNVTTVRVTELFRDASGQLQWGTVTFTPVTDRPAVPGTALLIPAPVNARVQNGVLNVDLVASDDPDVLPGGWAYSVVEDFPGVARKTYLISVTSAMAPKIRLSSIAPLGTSPALVPIAYVRTLNGQSGDVTLPMGNAALLNVGTVAGTVAAGDDARLGVEAMPVSSGLTWTGTVNLTTLAATAKTIQATLTGAVTLTLPTPAATVSYTVTLVLTQDGTGGRTLTLPAPALSAYGVDPVLSTTAGATDLVHLLWTGAAWIALMAAPAVG